MSIFLMALGPGSKIFEWLKKYICILLTKSCFDKEMVIFIPFNMFKLCIIQTLHIRLGEHFLKEKNVHTYIFFFFLDMTIKIQFDDSI